MVLIFQKYGDTPISSRLQILQISLFAKTGSASIYSFSSIYFIIDNGSSIGDALDCMTQGY